MTDRNDIAEVLGQWGDDTPGPMNGALGKELSDDIMTVVTASIRPSSDVCDLGCGNGFLASRVAAAGHRVVGVDASERLLSVARSRYQSDRVEFRQGFIGPELSALLDGRQFDAVVSIDVIEHLYRPLSLVEAAHDLLKPGGRFIVCTPYHGYLKNVAISVLGKWDWHHNVHWDGGHIKFFSPATLGNLVRSKFSVDRFTYHGRVPWLWRNMICVATKSGA